MNTRLYKAIGACTLVYDTDLQRGACRDVTIEIYAHFQSLSLLFGASLSEPRIHEEQEAVLYVYMYVYILVCIYVCGVIISVRKELN